MGAIIHKMCERAEQELWDVLKENKWSKDHAEIAFYLTEIMKGAKKIEHLAKLDEAMEKFDKEEEEQKKMMKMKMEQGEEPSQFARGGNRGGGRSSNSSNYAMFEYEEDEDEGDYVRRMRGRGNYNQSGNYTNLPMIPPPYRTPDHTMPINYTHDPKEKYYEEKYKELLEEKWEKEKKENKPTAVVK